MAIKPIRTPADLRSAKTQLAEILSGPNAGTHDDEIEVLTTLIEQFEQKHSPIDAPDPISAIKFRMEEKGLTARQLEPYIGSRARVSEVLSGKRQLSIDMIRSLHEGLGIPYEALISDRRQKSDVNISAPTIQRLNDLGFDLKYEEVHSFISSLNKQTPFALLRKTRTQRAASKTDQHALLMWQAVVLHEAGHSTTSFQRSVFGSETLRQIARISPKPDGPKRAIRRLAELGISVVIMPPLPGTFLDGAAMANQLGNPVIGLTLRHDRVDSFWFTLLHECAHVSLHFDAIIEGDTVFVDDMEIQSEDEREREADALARDCLIPPNILSGVPWGHSTTQEDLMALATRARVHPSVAAGRWQRDHQNYKKFSRLIDRNSIRPMLIKFENEQQLGVFGRSKIDR